MDGEVRRVMVSEIASGLGTLTLGASIGLAIAAPQTSIGPDSVVNLGTVAGICGGILWLNVTLTKIQNRLKRIEETRHETWTWNQMRAWALDLQNKNRDLNIPEPLRPVWATVPEEKP